MMTSSRIRWVGVALIVLAAVSGVVITASTSTTTADRSLSVSVAGDTDAYIAVEDCAVRNHHRTNVVVALSHNGTTETVRLSPGEQHTVDATGGVELTVTEPGGTVESHLSREFACAEAST